MSNQEGLLYKSFIDQLKRKFEIDKLDYINEYNTGENYNNKIIESLSKDNIEKIFCKKKKKLIIQKNIIIFR